MEEKEDEEEEEEEKEQVIPSIRSVCFVFVVQVFVDGIVAS